MAASLSCRISFMCPFSIALTINFNPEECTASLHSLRGDGAVRRRSLAETLGFSKQHTQAYAALAATLADDRRARVLAVRRRLRG